MATISCLMLFKEVVAVYSENHTKHISTFCEQNADFLIIKAAGTNNYHWALKWGLQKRYVIVKVGPWMKEL
jgi:hypothetical protein